MIITIFHYSLWLCLWLCLWLWLLDMIGGTKRCRGWLKWRIIGALNAYLKNRADFSSFASSANLRLSLHVRWSFTLPPPFLNSLESIRCFLQQLTLPPPFLNSLESKRRFFLNGLYSSELESSVLESLRLFLLSRDCFFLNTLYSSELESRRLFF